MHLDACLPLLHLCTNFAHQLYLHMHLFGTFLLHNGC